MTRSASKYNLSDLHEVISGATAIVKKEKPPLVIPKAPVPALVKSSGGAVKKRKALEILDLSIDDLAPAEIMKKLATMVETVSICFLTLLYSDSNLFVILFRRLIRFQDLLRRKRRGRIMLRNFWTKVKKCSRSTNRC